jgi:uncharacterized protein (UPF0276 family)
MKDTGSQPVVTASINNLRDFDLIREAFAATGPARRPLIEVLWDNYCWLEPESLVGYLSELGDAFSLHIMWSRFLERDEDELEAYLKQLRRHVDAAHPVAVSDHLCRFTSGNVRIPFGQEWPYDRFEHVAARVEAIGTQLLLENGASTHYPVEMQVAFLDRLIDKTGCGVMFDVSNAVVGVLNGLGSLSLWSRFLAGRELFCHVGSYEPFEEDNMFYCDTHSVDVSQETLRGIAEIQRVARVRSFCLEREYKQSSAAVAADLRRITACVQPAAVPAEAVTP